MRMRALAVLTALLVLVVVVWAQSPAPAFPDARATDPVTLGWMKGSPPPAGKLVLFGDSSFYKFPQTRWAFSHMRELVPTVTVSRGPGPVSALPRAERTDLDAVTFTPIGQTKASTWAAAFDANYTDGIVVLHRGRIVYERYAGALTAERPHIAFSVTKSFVATLAAILIAEGRLDERATVARYVPDLRQSAFGDATIRQLLDMTTGLDYSEDYNDAQSPVWSLGRATGFLPIPPGYDRPSTAYTYLASLKKDGAHGDRFVYKTPNTDTLGWVLQRVTGQPLSDLLRDRIYSKLGAEQDAYFLVDRTGVEFAGGGLHMTLRDLARFGETMRLDGKFNGQQIVPKAFVDDVRRGGDRQKFSGAGYKTLPGGSYRSMWWVLHNEHGAYSARGIHGQAIYVDPAAEMVVARFGSHPLGANSNLDPMSLPAYDALARYLMKSS
jgi:CubicO group peptidase (beta-lactamase class C family)